MDRHHKMDLAEVSAGVAENRALVFDPVDVDLRVVSLERRGEYIPSLQLFGRPLQSTSGALAAA
jgi:hypothetical protein